MKFFNPEDYTIVYEPNYCEHFGTMGFIYKLIKTTDNRLLLSKLSPVWPDPVKMSKVLNSSKDEDELLKEFEKMLGEADLDPNPIKFPLDEDLEYPDLEFNTDFLNDREEPPPIPKNPKEKRKGVEHKIYHLECNVVTSYVVNSSGKMIKFLYCKDCKVEVE